ncbi:hypothetical protein [Verrucosispora sp. WMMC514]|uniref:hypothetical protein n=1 Tax=Verrucosispora sp. WMMC514 TaxID=3015156 RepID=UPI00248CDE8D|nr:hypothetical protein [Verrucosispora sp. WMMC514]WBB91454.1 hypothetical protein O7597_31610 [Verrucosispora sp. WMMC514]WBB91485.1 hypothetical protein O7597_00065 [Verrucosispora sp. WMMC514]
MKGPFGGRAEAARAGVGLSGAAEFDQAQAGAQDAAVGAVEGPADVGGYGVQIGVGELRVDGGAQLASGEARATRHTGLGAAGHRNASVNRWCSSGAASLR